MTKNCANVRIDPASATDNSRANLENIWELVRDVLKLPSCKCMCTKHRASFSFVTKMGHGYSGSPFRSTKKQKFKVCGRLA